MTPPSSATARAEPPHFPALGSSANPYVVAVIGNPNTGKTTLFNALTGLSQRTGNYPGVTIDSTIGSFTVEDSHFLLVDLPGSYSLAPRSPDEIVAVRALVGSGETSRPHAVLCIVDATNLERNLYLLTQILDCGLPVVVGLTMVDVAKREGIRIDYRALGKRLGAPVIPVHAARREGISPLRRAIQDAVQQRGPAPRPVRFAAEIESEVDQVARRMANGKRSRVIGKRSRFLAKRLLLDGDGLLGDTLSDDVLSRAIPQAARDFAASARQRLRDRGIAIPAIEVECRYQSIADVLEASLANGDAPRFRWTRRIDAVITHKLWGTVLFLFGMALVFQAIFTWAAPFMDAIDAAFSSIGLFVGNFLGEGAFRSLIVDGVIAGTGSVIVFIPQIAILFALITIMEDSGYMARAAFLMDRVMSGFGLSGRSFIPLLSSFACAVPGIMSARSIESRRDRLATIMIAPLMSCSARLPVYVLFIAAFIPARSVAGIFGLQGLTLFAMYSIGLLVAPLVALLLKRTALKGAEVPFLMELPPYKIPSWRVVLFRVYDR